MSRDEALALLRSQEVELRASGLDALYLFGSVARDQAGPDSDVDLAFEVHNQPDFSIIHQEKIRQKIEKFLGVPIDLIPKDAPQRVKSRAETDMVRVF